MKWIVTVVGVASLATRPFGYEDVYADLVSAKTLWEVIRLFDWASVFIRAELVEAPLIAEIVSENGV